MPRRSRHHSRGRYTIKPNGKVTWMYKHLTRLSMTQQPGTKLLDAMLVDLNRLCLRGYSLGSRMACFGAKAVQYGTVGLVMGTAGSSLVLGLTSLRSVLDKGYKAPPTYQPILGTGLGWLMFMSGSSNIRYNLINLVEDISYERCVILESLTSLTIDASLTFKWTC